jgi:hypothetical protein
MLTSFETRALLAFLVVGVVSPMLAQSDNAPAPASHGNDDCLVCHEDSSTTRAAGGQPVVVDSKVYAASVHGQLDLKCVDCHADVATSELPHAEKLQPANCSGCHGDAVTNYQSSVHARAHRADHAVAATCMDCHGMHDIRGAKDPESRTYHFNLPTTCGACHGNETVIAREKLAGGNILSRFQDSIHGRALNRSGLIVAPNCSDCHGSHDIRRRDDPLSRVHQRRVPATCGTCHEGIRHEFERSVHAAALASGGMRAPACHDCHTAHQIERVETERWKLDIIRECGTCHADLMEPYRRTFHGKVTELGFTRVAACSDCHGAHGILPASDPQSTVAPARLVKTCGRCHANANVSFVEYDPHPNPHDYRRSRVLWWINTFYTWLIAGLFAFFGLHTLLWFPRSYMARQARRRQGTAGREPGAGAGGGTQ